MLNVQGLCAFTAVAVLALMIVIKRRGLPQEEDIGRFFAIFMSGIAVPVAIDLCSLVLPVPRRASALVLPDLQAIYLAAGALVLLMSSCIAIGKLLTTYWIPDRQPAGAARTNEVTTASLRPEPIEQQL